MKNILIFEPDTSLSNALKSYLKMELSIASSYEEVLDLTYTHHFDIYIFNFLEGSVLLQELRAIGDNTHTIFLLEYYDIKHIASLYQVGDDFLTKPFLYEELKIKIEYVIRKLYEITSNIIHYKDLYYHIQSKQLFYEEKKIHLSPMETTLVELFFKNINTPLHKDTILQYLYHNEDKGDGALRVYISKLKKIGFLIQYDRVSGYVLRQ